MASYWRAQFSGLGNRNVACRKAEEQFWFYFFWQQIVRKKELQVLNFLDLTKEFKEVVGQESKVEVSLGLAYSIPVSQGNMQVLGIIPLYKEVVDMGKSNGTGAGALARFPYICSFCNRENGK